MKLIPLTASFTPAAIPRYASIGIHNVRPNRADPKVTVSHGRFFWMHALFAKWKQTVIKEAEHEDGAVLVSASTKLHSLHPVGRRHCIASGRGDIFSVGAEVERHQFGIQTHGE